jgi:spermidine synthase
VIGLGIGTISGYGRPGDVFRFYEINPLVPKIANRYFWYLSENPAQTDIVLGDARLSLEREPPQRFDVLAVDAFVSDSIPIHLLTREAFRLYWRHLKPDGILAVHVSNRFADLAPIVARAAIESGKEARLVHSEHNASGAISTSEWMIVTSRKYLLERLPKGRTKAVKPVKRAWTDDYSNIWSVLRL